MSLPIETRLSALEARLGNISFIPGDIGVPKPARFTGGRFLTGFEVLYDTGGTSQVMQVQYSRIALNDYLLSGMSATPTGVNTVNMPAVAIGGRVKIIPISYSLNDVLLLTLLSASGWTNALITPIVE